MLCMVSYPRRLKSGHITCYLNRTYHVLTTMCTFGGCRGARLVLESVIREWGSGWHERAQETVEENPQRGNPDSGQALFPYRRSCGVVPSARLRAALLGNRISAA